VRSAFSLSDLGFVVESCAGLAPPSSATNDLGSNRHSRRPMRGANFGRPRSHPVADLRDQLERTLSGSYSLDRELSGGGMSRGLPATDPPLHRLIVVKVLPGETAGTVSA